MLPCGHACAVPKCHDQQPPAISGWEQPRPPKNVGQTVATAGGSGKRKGAAAEEAERPDPPAVAAAAAAVELAAAPGGSLVPCPPCMEPVTLPCFGGHCTGAMPCHQAGHFPCQSACGRALACGNHTCSKPCHVLVATVFSAAPASAGDNQTASFDPRAAASVAQRLPQAAQACEACERPCGVARAGCQHPCPKRCHAGACPPCAVPRTHPCSCGKTTLSFPCHELQAVQAAGDGSAKLSCGKPCHRALPSCQHPCRATCHAGACADGGCKEEVTVRCECRRQKQKWDCGQARAALTKATGSGVYDAGATSLKLLACDAECAAQKAKKGAAGQRLEEAASEELSAATASAAAAAVKDAAVAAAAASAAAGGAAKASAKRMSRAERDALSVQRAEQQLAAARREKQLQQAVGIALAVVVVGLGLWAAVALRRLAKADGGDGREL